MTGWHGMVLAAEAQPCTLRAGANRHRRASLRLQWAAYGSYTHHHYHCRCQHHYQALLTCSVPCICRVPLSLPDYTIDGPLRSVQLRELVVVCKLPVTPSLLKHLS